jgi:hypothetical protein
MKAAGLGFRIVVRVGLGRRGLLRRSDFGAQPRQLVVERALVGEHLRELLVALAQFGFEPLQGFGALQRCGRRHGRRPASAAASKSSPGAGRAVRP